MHFLKWKCMNFYEDFTEVFFPKDPINNISALVQIMAWHRSGDKWRIPVYASLGLSELETWIYSDLDRLNNLLPCAMLLQRNIIIDSAGIVLLIQEIISRIIGPLIKEIYNGSIHRQQQPQYIDQLTLLIYTTSPEYIICYNTSICL